MPYGVNLLLFGDVIDRRVVRKFGMLSDLGFDGVEVPIFQPGAIDVDLIRRNAERRGLKLSASGALPPGSNFYGTKARRKAATAYLRGAVRVAAELGATVLCGPLYKPVGDTDRSVPPADQRRETARALKPLADEALEAGVVLALEPLNRFETDFLNTTADAIKFARSIRSRGAGLLLDTFHMHIEEKDPAGAVRSAARAGVLAHFHASENDRGVAGTGQVRWDEIARALRGARYGGWIVLESFSQSSQAIRRAVSCWRPFYPSARKFLAEGLKFARKTFPRKGYRAGR